MLRKTVVITPTEENKKAKKKRKNGSYPPTHATIEDTIRHNIAQITSTSNACMACLPDQFFSQVNSVFFLTPCYSV